MPQPALHIVAKRQNRRQTAGRCFRCRGFPIARAWTWSAAYRSGRKFVMVWAMSDTVKILERANGVLIGNYARLPVVMVRGQGSTLWDSEGKKYLDLFAGFGACVLGHSHPALIAAAAEQASQLWHVGNTFHTLPQIELGEHLNRTAFPGRAFFCHSGLEANEAAVKLARLHGQAASPKRWKIVSMNRSFHGRSLAMIAATGNPAVKAGFEPMVPGFTQIDLGDLEGLAAA